MPNWCYNLWEIEGDELSLSNFLVSYIDLEEESILFKNMFDDNRTFRVTAVHIDQSKGKVTVDFDSAWDPPADVESVLIRNHPDLSFTFTYYECGSEIIGMTKGHDGAVTYEKHYLGFDYTDNEFVNFIRKTGMECEEYIQEMIDEAMKDQDDAIYS